MTSAFSSTARAPPSTARCASSSETEALTSTTGTRGPFAREAQEVEARAAGHPVVGHDEIDGRALQEGRRLGDVGRLAGGHAEAAEPRGEEVAPRVVVVDYEDERARRLMVGEGIGAVHLAAPIT